MSDTIISSVSICPKCKYTNPKKSKFCMQCGAPISASVSQERTGKLILTENGKPVKEFPLTKKTVLGKGGDIAVTGADFAKSICELKYEDERIILKVLQDGVYIKVNNDKPLELESGAELKIGDQIFKVEIE